MKKTKNILLAMAGLSVIAIAAMAADGSFATTSSYTNIFNTECPGSCSYQDCTRVQCQSTSTPVTCTPSLNCDPVTSGTCQEFDPVNAPGVYTCV